MRKNTTLKRNNFSYIYDDYSETLFILYKGYDYDVVETVAPKRVESTFNQKVEQYIREARNKRTGSTVL